MLLSFRGGVDTGNKSEFLNGSDIQFLPPPDVLSIPVPESCAAIVSAGENVCRGQMIAVTENANGACLSSPVSGKILKTGSRIVIENDGNMTACAAKLDTGDYIEFLSQAGVCDEYGVSSAEKFAGSPSEFIINCVEDQPYFVNVQAVLTCCLDDFFGGMEIIRTLFENTHIKIAVTSDIEDLSKPLRERYSDDSNVEILTVCGKYPQSCHSILKRTVSDNTSAAVLDAEELCNISKAFRTGAAITEKLITLSGDCVKRTEVFLVPYGTPMSFLLRASSGFKREPMKVLKGGVMSGKAIYNLRTPTDRFTSSVLTLFDHQHRYAEEAHCIGCSRCVSVCPQGLSPRRIIDAYKRSDVAAIRKLGISHCIMCSSCSYICPSRVNLPIMLKAAKLMGE